MNCTTYLLPLVNHTNVNLDRARRLVLLALFTLIGIHSECLHAQSSTTDNTITITKGGTYSGDWISNNPNVAAVTVSTDDPVVIQNSTVRGRGHLIVANGKSGANLTVRNVTGTGFDPNVNGKARGAFLVAYVMNSLVVQNCTMSGVSFGIKSAFSTLSTFTITNNVATNLEDRASDGNGGFLTTRPQLGHFVLMHQDSAPNGEIGWNQIVQTMGSSSVEDVINIYLSNGSVSAPISVHDNYMEGYSSAATTKYSGNGVIADGDNTGATYYLAFTNNQMVHTAGGGVAIAAGHDISASGNRVVSCGMDSSGSWYARKDVAAIYVGNYYGASNFANNAISTTGGGLVTPDAQLHPMVSNISAVAPTLSSAMTGNSFTDPCMVNGSVNLNAEDAERSAWQDKVANNAVVMGDKH